MKYSKLKNKSGTISPLLSIITVVYNAEFTLEHTLRSVINQTYNNIQYIIIDGASTDHSINILNNSREQISILVSEKDKGIYDAMNKGLKLATGDWVYFLGADDLLSTPTIIEEFVTQFTSRDHIYYGNTYLKNSNRAYTGKVNKWTIPLRNISHQAIFYPQSVYQNKNYKLEYIYFADHVYNLELFGADKNKFTYIPALVSIYNDLGRSSTNRDRLHEKNLVRIVYQNLGLGVAIYTWFRRTVSHIKSLLLPASK